MYITEDILVEILLRLPARSLVRFKCLSKHWCSFISNSEFCHRHTLYHSRRRSISAVLAERPNNFGLLPFIPLDDQNGLKTIHYHGILNPLQNNHQYQVVSVVQSCNGLLLLEARGRGISTFYAVCNPTTNQFTALDPFPPRHDAIGYISTRALAFDPSKSSHYKVLRIWVDYTCREVAHHIDVYSSESRTWRLVDSTYKMNYCIGFNEHQCVYWNGALHWLRASDEALECYHIEDQRVTYVPGRARFGSMFMSRSLQESHSGSHLNLIGIENDGCHIQVSKMGRDYSGWRLAYRFDFGPILTQLCPQTVFMFDPMAPLFVHNSSTEKEDEVMLIHVPGQLVSYNLKSDSYSSVRLTRRGAPDDDIDDLRLHVGQRNFPYMESLAPV